MRLILVRHGQTVWNTQMRIQGRTDTELNDEGKRQAQALGERLRGEQIAAIYTSPLKRARQTAAALCARCDVVPTQGLIELDFGQWEGMCFCDVAQRYPSLWLDWKADPSSVRIPEAETMEQVNERCLCAVRRIAENHAPSQTVLVVSHTMPIKLIIAHYLGLPHGYLHRFRLDNCAINAIELASFDEGTLITLNETV